jgi:anti-sigma-K factor RskA
VNCVDFKQDIAAYVLGALEPDEMAAMDRHLVETTTHEGCRDALAQAEASAAELALLAKPIAPSERVWHEIERRVARPNPVRPPARWREAMAWSLTAAAAAALLVVNDQRVREGARAIKSEQLLASASSAAAERDLCLQQLESLRGESRASLVRDAMVLLEKPATRVVALTPAAGGAYRASAVVNVAERRAIILASALPAIAGKDFELWVIRGKDAPVPAGFMRAGADGAALGEIDPAVLAGPAPDAFAVSVEPLGGRPAPTEVIMSGALHG